MDSGLFTRRCAGFAYLGVPRYNPTDRLVVRGGFVRSTLFPDEDVELQWSITRTRDSHAIQILDPGFLSTSASGNNLVINAAQMEAGQQYTVRLTATGRDGRGFAEVDISMNSAPSGGVMAIKPTDGVATTTSFSLNTLGAGLATLT